LYREELKSINDSLSDLYSPATNDELPLRFGRDGFIKLRIEQAKGSTHEKLPESGYAIGIRSGRFSLLFPADTAFEFGLQYVGEKTSLVDRLHFGQSSDCYVSVETSQPSGAFHGSAILTATNSNGKQVELKDINITRLFFRYLPIEGALEVGNKADSKTLRLDGCKFDKNPGYSSSGMHLYSFAMIITGNEGRDCGRIELIPVFYR